MKPRVSFYIVKHRENLWNTGKTQGKHREFDLGKNVATLKVEVTLRGLYFR